MSARQPTVMIGCEFASLLAATRVGAEWAFVAGI
jgi:hypothetical protein